MERRKKIYRFKGIRFYQEELTVEQDIAIKQAIDAAFKEEPFSERASTVAEIIDKLQTEKSLDIVLNVALKFYEPTPLHRLWHDLRLRMLRTTRSTFYKKLPLSMLGEIIADFFSFNPTWLQRLTVIAYLSGSPIRKLLRLSPLLTNLSMSPHEGGSRNVN
jgi:hypothetical protein